MRIGTHVLKNNLFVAPMAGVTDRPFRKLAKRFGAGLAVSEMTASNPRLRDTVKSLRRRDHDGEPEPIAVQIAGAEPGEMAAAARANVAEGAQIIDINMGCPAKKVCNVAAGSALLRDEPLVGRILDAVVRAVDVPVTLKFRTGWDPQHKNALRIAKIAEQSGIRLLALHGRTRACGYAGAVEYDTIREVKASTRLPVIANGDIASPQRAKQVLEATGADGVMIGRAAQGRPWLFREIEHFLATGAALAPPLTAEIGTVLIEHLHELYVFYGRETGLRVARKHVAWYTKGLPEADRFRRAFNGLETCEVQLLAVDRYFQELAQQQERLRYDEKKELAA
jgi:tRNA-dihydrouridine synthase B